jgi:chorismate lyase/3-hydroxybenzoate synthase
LGSKNAAIIYDRGRANVSHRTVPLPQSSRLIADPPPHLFPRPPLWVDDALGADARRRDPVGRVDIVAADPLALLAASVPGARGMSADTLRAHVSDAYIAIGHTLTTLNRVPIRFWNFVPDPGEPMGGGLDRYMVFNAGRFNGYAQWLCASNEFGRLLPTASAVGIISDDLVIYCLASDTRGTPVENPRQKPAYKYSRRYGPMPPCFSRATIANVNRQRRLLVGGTASIVGEDSMHEGDVDAQLDETLKNLEALIDAAAEQSDTATTALSRLLDLRVYVARHEDAPAIRAVLTSRCPRAERIELTIARVCRPELLVEIEGVAEI